jgi:tight adherence protein B
MNFIFFALLLWVLFGAAWWILSRVFQGADADKIKNRLIGVHTEKSKAGKKSKKGGPLIHVEDRTTGKMVIALLSRFQLQDQLAALIEQAGLKWKVARLMHSCLALFLVGFWLSWTFLPPKFQLAAVLLALLAGSIPLLYLLRLRASRMHQFEEQFPESLEFVARSLRAGHAFSVTLELLHREFREPLSGEFRRAFEEHNLGLPLDMALQKLAERIPLLDVHFFVSAVLLQKRTGGNLAEILDKLAYVIRERFKLRGKIKAISAHGRMTGMALSLIPVVVGALMFVTNPEYISFFVKDELGNYMAFAAIALQLIGYGVIQKIVNIEV